MDKAITPTQTIPLSTIARRRMRTSREEMATLDEFYRKNPNPNQEEKKEIAKIVHMGPKNVHFWFQNRRAKDNRKKKALQQQSGQPKVQQPSSSPSRSKEHLLRSSTNINNAGKRPLYNPATEALQLPPISDLIITPVRDLDIPFYFYHSKFGIEESLVQWTKGRENKPSN